MTLDARMELERALAEADIGMDVGRFVRLIREALLATARARAHVDPGTQLTEDELSVLRRGGVSASSLKHDRAAGRVLVRTATETAALLARALTTAEAAKRLGVDPSRIRQLLADRQLLAAKAGGEWRIVDLQFTDAGLVPNVGRVVRALPEGMPVLAAANWLTTPEPDLEVQGRPRSPLEWLIGGGDAGRVAALAADL
ncbi:MAG TPA: helix-turn-helix domain-containing protein [Candidatus Deferrimicrobiaceae bacterium]|nr:helix-turn-helix domain-containing protein [Candidatus Deferrimicrobiaceae bacterium]